MVLKTGSVAAFVLVLGNLKDPSPLPTADPAPVYSSQSNKNGPGNLYEFVSGGDNSTAGSKSTANSGGTASNEGAANNESSADENAAFYEYVAYDDYDEDDDNDDDDHDHDDDDDDDNHDDGDDDDDRAKPSAGSSQVGGGQQGPQQVQSFTPAAPKIQAPAPVTQKTQITPRQTRTRAS